eukprot:2173104-Prymnesium_polylepis.1
MGPPGRLRRCARPRPACPCPSRACAQRGALWRWVMLMCVRVCAPVRVCVVRSPQARGPPCCAHAPARACARVLVHTRACARVPLRARSAPRGKDVWQMPAVRQAPHRCRTSSSSAPHSPCGALDAVSYTHLRAHETLMNL